MIWKHGTIGRRSAAGLVLGAMLALLGGCKLLAAPFIIWGETPTKTVPADYPHLEGKKVCIVIWAEMDTTFEYPNVQLELGEFVRVGLESNVKDIKIVPVRQVVDFQKKDSRWDRMKPAAIGARFNAERVLALELTQYTTREPENPYVYRGRVAAYLKIYDVSDADTAPLYRTEVTTVYPTGTSGEYGTNDAATRRATMEQFALDVAAKFYERKVKQ